MKKLTGIFLILVVMLTALAGCKEKTSYEDGVYFAQQMEFPKSGWKYNVTLVVEGGEIKEVMWNGSNVKAGPDKVSLSMSGGYPMVAQGGAQAEWHEQAETVENYFVDNPALEMPDAISGASIHYNEFYDLVKEAIEKGPVGYGPYKDGSYHAGDSDYHNGWKYYVDLTVTSGYVVSAHWNAEAEDGGTHKVQRSADGEYGMVANSGATREWHEQAMSVEQAFLASQDTSSPDAISGATITYSGFYDLAEAALKGAMR
ncbi:MAG: FMN-binding protein [Spirochaetales bacterium]|nr:FMN-binding protein [Spirochaetales bacterium]